MTTPPSSTIVRVGVPADLWCPHQGINREQHGACHQNGSSRVEVSQLGPASVIANQPESCQENKHRDWRVYEEDPSPTRSTRQHPAEEDSDTRRESGKSPPCPERLESIATFVEVGRQDREGGRSHHGGAQSLNEAGPDQSPRGLGQTAGH